MNAIKRGYQMINAKVGRADETVNIGYNQEVEKFKAQYKLMKKLISSISDYLKALKALGQAHAGLNEGIASFYDMASDLWTANLKNQEVGLSLDKYRMGLDEQLDLLVVAPLNKHLAQYKEMKKRMKERENRRLDFDRSRAEVKSLTVNPSADPQKLQKAQRQLAINKHAFEELETELMRDLPLLHNDRLTFFDPCFATLVRSISGYYRAGVEEFGGLEPLLSHLDGAAIHNHAWVITDPSRTAAKKKKGDMGGDEYDALPPPSGGFSQGSQGAITHSGSFSPYTPSYSQPQQSSYGGGGAMIGYNQPPPSQGFGPQRGGSFSGSGIQGGPPPSGGGGPGRGRPLPTRPPMRGGPSQARQQAQAMYAFQAQSDQELSFNYGDVLTVINNSGEWWECEFNGRRGLVPGNYLQLK